ncbi:hypothetical protein [Stenotrophomonas sp.]|uniref:hypothetical protein n=1 Tax=Stenotrophomonas sp. TaxID=69392 RepID=UPI00289D8104|nr:hypothetical protein [Stenotrophomonas sp.]
MGLTPSIRKLVDVGSGSLSPDVSAEDLRDLSSLGGVYEELAGVLVQRNGFYAFESAFHLLPWQSSPLSVGVDDWNSQAGWRCEYGPLADGCLFFAEDVFGGQFCLKAHQVWHFEPETGALDLLGSSVEAWATTLLEDFEFLTGYPLALEWQKANGALPAGMRLVPKLPFVLGGGFSLDNLVPMSSERSLRARGSVAARIGRLPDGAQIRLVIDGEG